MSEWLDLMLGEIERKKREKEAALEELERRREKEVGQDEGDDEASSDGK